MGSTDGTDTSGECRTSRPRRTATVVRIEHGSPSKRQALYSMGLENPELHIGGAMSAMYLKSHGRYYLTQSYQCRDGQGPDQDLAMIVFDITNLPDTTKIKELKRIRVPEGLGGMHESFGYKHSNGHSLLFASSYTPYAYIYDIDDVVNGVGDRGIVGKIPLPDSASLWQPK